MIWINISVNYFFTKETVYTIDNTAPLQIRAILKIEMVNTRCYKPTSDNTLITWYHIDSSVVIKGDLTFVLIEPTRLCPHDCAHTIVPTYVCAQALLSQDTFVPKHVCAQTRLFPDLFVPTHVCTQARLCPHTFVPRHDCVQTRCSDMFLHWHVKIKLRNIPLGILLVIAEQ